MAENKVLKLVTFLCPRAYLTIGDTHL